MSQQVPICVNYRRILLAEDDQEMRSLLAWTLRKAGYKVVECRNGFELFQRLRSSMRRLQNIDYDLLVADIRMPGFNAFEVLEDMKSRIECPPIILITSFGDDETHRRAKRMGVAAMFDKPFDMGDFIRKVCELTPYEKKSTDHDATLEDTTIPNPHTE